MVRPGSLIKAKVVDIQTNQIIVDACSKAESFIPISEFQNSKGEIDISVGDDVDVFVEAQENSDGNIRLSYEKAKKEKVWKSLEDLLREEKNVKGVITERVKGGFIVDLEYIKAFLPGSLVDIRPVKDPSYLEGNELDFRLIKLDRSKNNIVVSRRAVLLEEFDIDRKKLLESFEVGQEVSGIVKNITDYGAFVDLGGIDGLLHITDISWKKINDPKDFLSVGDEIKIKILALDKEKGRVSLGLKQTTQDPWKDISKRYPQGHRMFGNVTNITDYGFFVEIEDGIEGLVHMSEIDWTNKNVYPAKYTNVGDEHEVMILNINEEKHRISLGIKQCFPNPWVAFSENHEKGDHITGIIKSITEFGLFVGLEGDIDGLVHVSDLSWNDSEKAIFDYKKGQEVEAVVLGMDIDRERISLGIKQLEEDVLSSFIVQHPKGTVVRGSVKNVDQKKAIITLTDDVEGILRASKIAETRVDDVSSLLEAGEEVEAVVIGYDRKNRFINLSISDLENIV